MTSEVMQPNSLLNFSSVKIRGHDLPSGTERILCSCGQGPGTALCRAPCLELEGERAGRACPYGAHRLTRATGQNRGGCCDGDTAGRIWPRFHLNSEDPASVKVRKPML